MSTLARILGGPARGLAIGLLAAVLALQAADSSTVGAVGAQLERSFDIDHVQLALLASISSLLGAAATIPFGVLADRVTRVRALSLIVAVWGFSTVAAGLAGSFLVLLGSRLFLGVAIAAAGPLLASLIGDLFPTSERAQIYSYILSGELAGTGFGFLVSGNIAGLLSWRWAFWVLAAPAWLLAWTIHRRLPEPARGGGSRLARGAQNLIPVEAAKQGGEAAADDDDAAGGMDRLAQRVVRREHVKPDPEAVLRGDPRQVSLWQAARYVLGVRTNLILIVVSATGYFFLGGLQTFAVIFVRRNYGLDQSAATSILTLLGVGAVVGALVGGRLADGLLRRGKVDARIVVSAVAFCGAAAIALPPFVGNWPLAVAMPLFVLGTAVLTSGNPPLDAARLDVIPAGLWGRAESLRTVLRSLAVAAAPLLFGWIASRIGHGRGEGLRASFSIMLLPLCAAGLILLRARRTYPTDVATALAGQEEREDE